MGQSIAKVDAAWVAALSGATLSDATPVAVFIEEPAVENVPTRTYPSISVMLIGFVDDLDRREGDQEGERYKAGEILLPAPPESLMKPVPTPMRLLYQVATWAKQFAKFDRELMEIVNDRFGLRGTLLLLGTGDAGEDELVHAMRAGLSEQHERLGDMVIYHRSFTFEVYVELGPDDVVNVKQATEFQFGFFQGQPPAGEPILGDPSLDLDVVVIVTE